ncbi:MAG: MarR family winged helix-turn-helix transcriptional regulator [Verrucomicrobiota bacterium]
MSSQPSLEQMHELANSVRRTYNSLRHATDQIHEEVGISAPKRTLLMDIFRLGPQTVPALAASRYISRQIIQTQVNELKAEGYLEPRENPEHKRSRLITLTASGQKLVQSMTDAENAYIRRLGWLPDSNDLNASIRLLDAIHEQLDDAT